ncbi:MAG TPA: Rieske 2Fe-2S domain-containing protein [Ornithinimicrobium sp.]|uniref:cytochrome bc1 complex Rieske iron-sulfur subunit n=1 Tax=Ornithinimicrobium sp. TaxID=1977084 RepID=UPI002B4A6D51|nr:Rieske 2Fe-2S domain-containing protein [Ornithinimicrobium sp.]HKJ11211.1 Rieske 2Fe-2S domain-containing protein [Ornithinimicrobium sp.]
MSDNTPANTSGQADHSPATQGDSKLPERFENPGLPPHVPRRSDVDVKAAKRAERQVVALFTLSALGTVGFVIAYLFIPMDARGYVIGIGEMDLYHLALGITMTLSLGGIGFGAVHWAKTLMPDEEVVEERHEQASDEETREGAAAHLRSGWKESQLGRRPLILQSAAGALGLFAIPLVLQLGGSLGPAPGRALYDTNWKQGLRLLIDPSGVPVKASDVTIGSVFHIMPEGWVGEEAHEEHTEHEIMEAKAEDQVILVRLDPEVVQSQKSLDWGYEGILAYSKVCTHVGCPVALYEQQTHHLLCPCHQSTFDMTNDCEVIFGPAGRPLPQLPITVDAEGYLVADDSFKEPVGPSFWERG